MVLLPRPSMACCKHTFIEAGSGPCFLPDLIQGFAVNAKVGSRSCFQSADADLYAARITVAIFIVVNVVNGLVDLFDEFAFAVAGAQFKAKF
jgi:hypothetical protein